MKKFTTYLSFFALTIIISVSNLFGQTTTEEYNYITKGYKAQMENGLDMKTGYKLKISGEWTYTNKFMQLNCEFKELYRINENKIAATMMIIKKNNNPSDNCYVCIPSLGSSPEMWNQSINYINSVLKNEYQTSAIIWALINLTSKQTAILERLSNNRK